LLATAKSNTVKLCPFCAEEIQDAAIKCKHCGSMLGGFGSPPALPKESPSSPKDAIPWYFKPGMLVVSFLVVGPLMLPLLWLNPRMSRGSKLVWTLVISVVSLFLFLAFMKAIAILKEYYRLMGL
jgi:hypothetical protein